MSNRPLQVGARVSQEVHDWLTDTFKNKSAGAELILPWARELYYGTLPGLLNKFTETELVLIISAYRNVRTTVYDWTPKIVSAHLDVYMGRHGVSKFDAKELQQKIGACSYLELSVLVLWATNCSYTELDPIAYIQKTAESLP